MNLSEVSSKIQALIQGAEESVVQVLGRARLPASGVVWCREADHSFILTANHVVEHGRSLHIRRSAGESIAARIVGRIPEHDLALLRIEQPLPAAAWRAEKNAPPVGELVLALGRTHGALEASLGIIRAPAIGEAQRIPNAEATESQARPEAVDSSDEPWDPTEEAAVDAEDPWQDTIEKLSRSAERAVQHAEEIARRAVRNFEFRDEFEGDHGPPHRHYRRRPRMRRRGRARFHSPLWEVPMGVLPLDITLYPGFSGGPLLNLSGQVIGINTSAFGNVLTLPHSLLQPACAALQEQKPSTKRAFLGVSGQAVRLPAPIAREWQQESGILLTSIQEGSAAETAGLLLGDILLSLDGERISTLQELHAALTNDRIGKPLPLHLIRAGETKEVSLHLGERS
ncbi:MAG: S1C family serine protease [Chloroflexi bacterium]|nr:S1C family serine protease [Chloroflexota bacterium]